MSMTLDFVDVDNETMNSNRRYSLTTKKNKKLTKKEKFSFTCGDVFRKCSTVSADADGGIYV